MKTINMIFKRGDIVVTTTKPKKVDNWTFGHARGTVCEVTHVAEAGVYPYNVRYLNRYVGCANRYSETEIAPASDKIKKKFTKEYIARLFGECDKRGCTDTCSHS